MKILSWNINGIRASKRNLKELFDSLDADVICLQETKVTRDMLDEPTAVVDGYSSYYSYSRKRSGYSGVATYCKDHVTPEKAEEGLSGILSSSNAGKIGHYGNHSSFTDEEIVALDAEGRAVLTQHKIRLTDGSEKGLCIINVYCPRFDPDREDRHLYKLRFYALLQTRAEALIENGSHVIILGDINTTHKSIDRSDNEEEAASRTPSRIWMNQMLWEKDKDATLQTDDLEREEDFTAITPYTKGGMFVDTYRYFYPDKEGAFSNWCTLTNARSTNYGRRLDYIFADVKLSGTSLKDADILQDVQGSDHCPVKLELTARCVQAKVCPPHCTKFMPEFSGKQQKLSSFFTKLHKKEEDSPITMEEVIKEKLPRDKMKCDLGENKGEKRLLEKPDVNKGEKRRLEKSSDTSVFSQTNKRVKTNGKVNQSKSGQSTLKSFFSKPKVITKQTIDTDKLNTFSDNKTLNLSSQELKPGTKSESVEVGENKVSKYFMSEEQKQEQRSQKQSLVKDNSKETAKAWKSLLGGLGPAPPCKGHNEPCVLRMVKKEGPNKGKQFYVCARGEGLKNNPEARCDFFKWVEKRK